jgi:hypothetical protein
VEHRVRFCVFDIFYARTKMINLVKNKITIKFTSSARSTH